MSDDLVKRLHQSADEAARQRMVGDAAHMREAADRIEALAAERDALAEKLGRVTAAYRLEAMRRDDYSHEAFDLHLAKITGGEPRWLTS